MYDISNRIEYLQLNVSVWLEVMLNVAGREMDLYKKVAGLQIIFIIILVCGIQHFQAKQNAQKTTIEELTDIKDFKKILRTKNNVLVCYVISQKQASNIVKIFKEAAEIVKGQGTMLLVDCFGEARKMCRKLKVSPEPFLLKHYKDGEFHKDYDRLDTVQSMVNFMRDPTGDIPWEEDSTAIDVVHILDALSLSKFLRKEMRPILVLFYAPWCGFCKQLKPEYAAAATELKGHSVLAAIDVNRPENAIIRQQYNITGFPTMLYFENGNQKFMYEGENNKNGLVGFMKNPSKPPEKPKEDDWSAVKSDVVHLTSENFDTVIARESSVLVMFYAPWCGHCKKMKPEYEKAAALLKAEKIAGIAAALDATKEAAIAARYAIRGYPTVKYFRAGEFAFDINAREAAKIIEFMRNPREPPPPPPPETPWSEEPSEVVHLTEETFRSFLKKKKHVLVMFYAPWCGHCKKAKPEFTAAAEHFKDDPKVEFAAVDCTRYTAVCEATDVKGYPTIKYFHYHTKETKSYNGGRMESDFVNFMKNPLGPVVDATTAPDKVEQEEWGDYEGAENLVHLMDDTFDTFVSSGDPVLVMFYAPWCGHCKRMKPSYSLAALQMKAENIPGVLATVDTTVNPKLSSKFNILGFPTLKYFNNGKFISDYDRKRSAEDIKTFMKSPPPLIGNKDEL
ncbi:Protein disulfide-isomerase A5 [Cryptotermes secundus]|uniref:Protein disulfide-isomerase A5 n=1 Tax=Cryptotermes secundus TaxID=105785 RepID=A0A2J7QUC2_9NEOP|nr:protein disulfide-isomerase A5 isoform X2 [Cryptotermes secundus]PNF32184.1 Protein disulfide-isomerase A5 [Cryptotermes secundus]